MTALRPFTVAFAVAPQLSVADVPRLARRGIRAIIAVRPDGEDPKAAQTAAIAAEARRHGMSFAVAPAAMHDITSPEVVERFAVALAASRGPVVAYCKSGTRAAMLWAQVAARHLPVANVLATAQAAGIDLSMLADELAACALPAPAPAKSLRRHADLVPA